MKKINNYIKQKHLKPAIGMVFGTIIYCVGVVWIINVGNFYAGGVTGISQIIVKIFGDIGIKISLGLFVPLLNLPLFLIGYKHVSKRFAYLTLISVILQTVVIFILEKFESPLRNLEDQKLILAITGGLICGFGSGITLRAGTSTGGMDIISQYFYFKKKIPFTKFSLSIDLLIIVFGGIVNRNIETSIYTSIRLVISILTIDQLYTIYKLLKISIVTTKKDELCEALISKFNHGITIFEVTGGYSKSKKWVVESVISRFESEEYKNVALAIDDKAFMSYVEVKGVVGFFNQNTIA